MNDMLPCIGFLINKHLFSLTLVILLTSGTLLQAQEWESNIVFEGADGRLEYVSDSEGNRIPDFSHAGYGGGGVDLPMYPVVHTIAPIEGDNTGHIQEAIDLVSAMEPGDDGVRGALLLEAGVYEVSEALTIRQHGIVLRGMGDGADAEANTIIRRVGTSTDPVIQFGGGGSTDAWQERPGTRSDITSDFVAVGSRSFSVANPDLYAIGDQIVVLHPLTDAWLAAVDGGGTDTDPSWETDEFDIAYTRRIVDIQNDEVFIDAPVFNHLDRTLTQSYIYKRDNTDEIREVGIEKVRVLIETNGSTSEDHAETAVEFVHVANAWASEVTALHFVYAGIDVRRSIHVTVKDSEALEPHSQITGGRRYNFAVYRSQLVLFENNLATEARHSYVGNGEAWDSGIVFLNSVSRDAYTSSEPHRHWGQGFLYDNHVEEGSTLRQLRLRLGNRGSFGTGHGWSAVHSVAWNCRMNTTTAAIEKPPTAQNYAIGCEGNISGTAGSFDQPGGYIEGANRSGLVPASLYEKQLEDRLSIALPVETPSTTSSTLSLSNFPNPFMDRSIVRVQTEERGTVVLDVYDILGRHVSTLYEGMLLPGVYEFPFTGHPGSGLYLVRTTFSTGRINEMHLLKMIKLHPGSE